MEWHASLGFAVICDMRPKSAKYSKQAQHSAATCFKVARFKKRLTAYRIARNPLGLQIMPYDAQSRNIGNLSMYTLYLLINGERVAVTIEASIPTALEVAQHIFDMYDNSPNPAHEVAQQRP